MVGERPLFPSFVPSFLASFLPSLRVRCLFLCAWIFKFEHSCQLAKLLLSFPVGLNHGKSTHYLSGPPWRTTWLCMFPFASAFHSLQATKLLTSLLGRGPLTLPRDNCASLGPSAVFQPPTVKHSPDVFTTGKSDAAINWHSPRLGAPSSRRHVCSKS